MVYIYNVEPTYKHANTRHNIYRYLSARGAVAIHTSGYLQEASSYATRTSSLQQQATSDHMFRKKKNKKQAKRSTRAFHNAARKGDLTELKRYVEEEGADAEEPDCANANTTALQYAAMHGHTNILCYLLETCDVDVDHTNDNYWTALLYAVHEKEYECAHLLVQHDADTNTADRSNGMTALMWAAQHNRGDLLSLLLRTDDCELEKKTKDTGDTAILLAAAAAPTTTPPSWFCVEQLLLYGASPMAKNNEGEDLLALKPPAHLARTIEASIVDHNRGHLLYRLRQINEYAHDIKVIKAKYPHMVPRHSVLPCFELIRRRGVGNEEEELSAVLQHVVGLHENGSLGGGLAKKKLLKLLDMLLPSWDPERKRNG